MPAPEFLRLADDPSLDFLNTLARREEGLHDFLARDENVLAWLRAMDLISKRATLAYEPGTLLVAARALRDTIRKLDRRRWCSTATCGNRHKVANFRARQRAVDAA